MRRGSRIVAVVCAVLGTCAVARAQSAVDGFDPGANDSVYDAAVQADGKIVVVGAFTMLGGGGSGTTTRNRIGRLNADGSLDTSFNPGANFFVYAVAVQADGKILVGGGFSGIGGGIGTTTRNRVARLNANGSVDPSFNPGADSIVWDLAVQPDGKILVGGYFTALGGGTGTTPRNHIGRLNADGSVDASFNPGADSNVLTMAVQADGKILVGGDFTMLGGGGTGTTPRSRIGRLNVDGSLDSTFFPGANAGVNALAVQPDGKIVVGGNFTGLGGGTGTTPRTYLGRFYANGSLETGLDPGFMDDSVYSVVVQPDGRILAGGAFHWWTGRDSLARFNADGSLDAGFDPGPRGAVQAIVVQADGKILIGGAFLSIGQGIYEKPRNHIGRLYADGSVDVDLNPGANDSVFAVAVQADGQILVGGTFIGLGGGTGTTVRNHIGRFRPDGLVDTTFDPGANNNVLALAVQPDGKILVGGDFTTLGGGGTGTTTRNFLGRLNPNGSLDASFNPGANNTVYAVVVQPDGKILIGGAFTGVGGGTGTTPRNRIARLNADGSLDASFNPGASFTVTTLALQPDEKILVGGLFTLVGGGGTGTATRNRIARLDADGSLDASFDPGADNVVWALTVQPDGKILVGGNFTGLGGGTGTTTRNFLGRLNAGGSLDTGFNPGADGTVRTLAVQADAKIVVGGFFTGLGGGTGTTTRNRIGRLDQGGSLDGSFNPNADNWVYAVALQRDGKILVGGVFTAIGAATRSRFGRLTNTDAAIQRLSVTGSGSVVTWARSGAGPEVWRVTFESSTDDATYTSLGSPTRVAGGWRLNGLSLPIYQNLFIRARGYHATGYVDGSGSIVESVRNVYVTYQPFADNVLTAGTSLIRSVHIIELRARVDTLRTRYGLLPFGWTGVLLAIKTAHVAELRIALQEAYTAAGQPAPTFTDPTIVQGSTFIRAVHIKELRDAVIDLEGS